jgi:RHS repeat-associated protein
VWAWLYQISETATATNTLTYHFDFRGSTVALTDDNGRVTDRIEYSAYGLTTYRTGTSDTPFLFNGRYGVMTDSNGLLYMRARYYNPYLCRFINPDPSGFAGGLNHYVFASGNPVSLFDPFGLSSQATGETYFSWMYPSLSSTYKQAGAFYADENADTFGNAVEFTANFLSGVNNTLSGWLAARQGGNEPQGGLALLPILFELPGMLTRTTVAVDTAATQPMITVIGSQRDVAPFVGRPGFNTFTGAGIPAAELDVQNALWLNNAAVRGDMFWQVTDPAAHAAFLRQLPLQPQSAYLNLEIPMLNQYSGLNIIPKYAAP